MNKKNIINYCCKTIFIFFVIQIYFYKSLLLANDENTSLDIIIKDIPVKNKPFFYPSGLTTDKYGNIFIVDSINARILVFSESGEFKYIIGKKGMAEGELSVPWGICIDNHDNLLVTDIGQHKIHVFDLQGKFLAQFGGKGSGKGKFNIPSSITTDKDGYIYVLDTGNSLVQVIKNKFLFQFGAYGSKDGEFINPRVIKVGSYGFIFVVDTGNSRIQFFTPKGVFVKKFGIAGTLEGNFSKPQGIAMDNEKNIYVADGENNRIQVFNSSGKFLFTFGKEGKEPGQFNIPGNLEFYLDKLIIADIKNKRIQVFKNIFQDYVKCIFCHQNKEELLKNSKIIHPPFKEACEECHNKHKNEKIIVFQNPGLVAQGNELCYNCHSGIHNNIPVKKSRCIDCHSPHAANTPKLLIGEHITYTKCISCHKK
ncbi:MAG: 6-bladed beta-propeller [Candidatus Firestonebacteria bacterium]|nr:6-bladed beta-propeller [Candidatus Firestonebacteria bacterium]